MTFLPLRGGVYIPSPRKLSGEVMLLSCPRLGHKNAIWLVLCSLWCFLSRCFLLGMSEPSSQLSCGEKPKPPPQAMWQYPAAVQLSPGLCPPTPDTRHVSEGGSRIVYPQCVWVTPYIWVCSANTPEQWSRNQPSFLNAIEILDPQNLWTPQMVVVLGHWGRGGLLCSNNGWNNWGKERGMKGNQKSFS